MKTTLRVILVLLVALPAAAQPVPNRANDLARIQRVCASVTADMSREDLLATVADCLDRVSPSPPAHAATGLSSLQLAPSGTGRLMVRAFNGEQIFYPDPALTLGDLSSRTTSDVCAPGFRTSSVRRTTEAMKSKVYQAYGLNPHQPPCPCEIDHWLSLEDEGTDGSEEPAGRVSANLWPEPYTGPYGARKKDRVETWIHKQLCFGTIAREQALDYMAHWPEIYDALESGADPFRAAGYEPDVSP
jgi:hypothetical protein